MAQRLTALTAFTEVLSLVPGTQVGWLAVTRSSSSPFWLPHAKTHPQTYSYTQLKTKVKKNISKVYFPCHRLVSDELLHACRLWDGSLRELSGK